MSHWRHHNQLQPLQTYIRYSLFKSPQSVNRLAEKTINPLRTPRNQTHEILSPCPWLLLCRLCHAHKRSHQTGAFVEKHSPGCGQSAAACVTQPWSFSRVFHSGQLFFSEVWTGWKPTKNSTLKSKPLY